MITITIFDTDMEWIEIQLNKSAMNLASWQSGEELAARAERLGFDDLAYKIRNKEL